MALANPYCCSSYLALRWVIDAGAEWVPGVRPRRGDASRRELLPVRTVADIRLALDAEMATLPGPDRAGILLSGGIDSAILAALMPRGTHAFTVRFVAPGALDESPAAARVAARCGLVHHVVDVGWPDCLRTMDRLMLAKGAPLHPVEVALHRAAQVASEFGLNELVVGNAADSTFGGMDKLLAVDWTFEQFIRRYTFLEPELALLEPVSMRPVFERYRRGDGVDVQAFLKSVHGAGLVEAFDNAIVTAGCAVRTPFAALKLDVPLDLGRIRGGEPKYLLTALFRDLFPGIEPPVKIPFARPMDAWMADAPRPRRPEFRDALDMSRFGGEQRWQLFSLERFLSLLDGEVTR